MRKYLVLVTMMLMTIGFGSLHAAPCSPPSESGTDSGEWVYSPIEH